MASTDKTDIILLSIHPQYAEAILEGKKKVEFRKKNIPRHIRHVLLYATSPVRRVVGYFSVAEVIETSPEEAWKRFNGTGGIEHKAFAAYYANTGISVVMVIEASQRFRRPIKLESVDTEARAPQSYRYVDTKIFKKLMRRVYQ